jgi:hypothetical protein
MWKSFFLALGIVLCFVGAECLAVQKFVLKTRGAPPPPQNGLWTSTEPKLGPQQEITPRDWAPWSLLTTGAVVCLYSFTIPRRMAGK